MHPRALVQRALAAHLDVLAICDHNSSENVLYVLKAAQGKSLKVFPGVEITSSEEVHLLALFDSIEDLSELQMIINQHLAGENDEERFGVQAIVNEKGEVEGLSNKLLIGATDLPLNDLIKLIHEQHGLAIASHIDRESFSVISQLGFIDKSFGFDALEVSSLIGIRKARKQYSDLNNYAFITSSDAHFLKDIGTASTKIMMEKPTLNELKMAFARQNGRYIME